MRPILHRVLSFDGGGIRGLYQAKLLEGLKARGLDVAERADVIAGTSTGAIIAAAVAIGKEPKDISKLYSDVGEKVFPPRWWISRVTSWARKASYSPVVLREELESQLGKNTKLGDVTKRLLMPATSLNRYKLKCFDSADEGDKGYRLVDVVLASAAAPTYFPPVMVGDGYYVDGGLCCNNPGFRAVAKLFGEKVELSKIYLLSISTGAVPITKSGRAFTKLRTFQWIRPIIDITMSGSSALAVVDSEMVGFHYRIVENFESEIGLDDYRRAMETLPGLAEGKAEEVRPNVTRWFEGPAPTGQDFSGTWETTYRWEGESTTDTLHIEQCGDHVVGETVGNPRWPYTLSGTVEGNTCIGGWKGQKLRGNFLLIISKVTGTVDGQWVGTSDSKPYFGDWSWKRKQE
jgi:uncharacterized protein